MAGGEVWTWSLAQLQMKRAGAWLSLGRAGLLKSLPFMVKRVCGLQGWPGGVGRDGDETHILLWSATTPSLSFLCFSGPQSLSL